jgi:hypothetical protein
MLCVISVKDGFERCLTAVYSGTVGLLGVEEVSFHDIKAYPYRIPT